MTPTPPRATARNLRRSAPPPGAVVDASLAEDQGRRSPDAPASGVDPRSDQAQTPHLHLVAAPPAEALGARAERSRRAAAAPRPVFAPPRGLYAGLFKRWLDLALVLAAAPIVLPVAAALALWVRLSPGSGGAPAFYGQARVGRGGRRFTCWKIRTMVPDAEAELDRLLARDPVAAEEWQRRQKLARDPRVTPAGRFLRASSLDELPQLWNVLVGDMSLVGPRPFTPAQRAMHPLPEIYESLRPGLTGAWQVGPRGEGGDFARRGAEDARYWRQIGLGQDLRIIARTFAVVLKGTGQ